MVFQNNKNLKKKKFEKKKTLAHRSFLFLFYFSRARLYRIQHGWAFGKLNGKAKTAGDRKIGMKRRRRDEAFSQW